MRPTTKPDLTRAQQFLFLRQNPICKGDGELKVGSLTWEYLTRPTPLSREYRVRIEYPQNDTPKVIVVSPELEALAKGRDLPHVYHDPVRLCLYLPGSGEWLGHMRIDQTFVPWASTWLYYFEEWLASDDWRGGGEHPQADDNERYNRHVRRAVR